MKKIFSFALVLLMGLQISNAQKIDRSKQPEAGPAPEITFKDPAIFTLKNGITVLVVENHKLPKVSATLSIDRGPVYEGEKAGLLSILSSMLEEGTTSMDKATFDKEVDQMGSMVSLHSSGGFVSSLTRYFETSFGLFADALKNPAFPQESFDKIKSLTLTELKAGEKSTDMIAGRVYSALHYGKNTAMGEFETEESIKALTLNDVKEAYKKYISPSRAYLTFVGDITVPQAKVIAEKAFGNWKGAELKLPSIPNAKNPSVTEINFVDVPSAVQASINVSNLIQNPLSNPDYHALALANQILGGGFEGKLFTNLREKHGFTYGSYSSVGNSRFQTTFSGSAQVRNEKVDSAVVEMIKEIENMRAGNFTQEDLDLAKAKYNGSFALGMENPARAAGYASDILINNLPKDYYRNFLKNINAVTLADVKRVSQKYFDSKHARIIIVGKGEDILPKLEELSYPIKMYDAFATPINMEALQQEKAAAAKAAAGITANQVIENYLKAIGGRDLLEKATSMSGVISMEVAPGQVLTGIIKKMNPNLSLMELTMNGMTVVKRVFDGTTGYQMQMGQKMDMEEDEINEIKSEKGIFEQQFYKDPGYKLEMAGAGKVNGEDAYKIKVTKPNGKTVTEFYNIKTGLFVRTESVLEMEGQEIEQVFEYTDYKPADGILTPTTMNQIVGGQGFTLTISDIKYNSGVKAEDFK